MVRMALWVTWDLEKDGEKTHTQNALEFALDSPVDINSHFQ